MTDCVFCDIINEPGDNATLVTELEHSVILLNFNQADYPGQVIVAYKGHVEDLIELPKNLRDAFNDEVMSVAAAIRDLYDADRINYCNLGNAEPHTHWHIIPRQKGDKNAGGPPAFTPDAQIEKLSDHEYRAIAAKIRCALRP